MSCCVFQRAAAYPEDVPPAEGDELVGRGGSAILAPDGSYHRPDVFEFGVR